MELLHQQQLLLQEDVCVLVAVAVHVVGELRDGHVELLHFTGQVHTGVARGKKQTGLDKDIFASHSTHMKRTVSTRLTFKIFYFSKQITYILNGNFPSIFTFKILYFSNHYIISKFRSKLSPSLHGRYCLFHLTH